MKKIAPQLRRRMLADADAGLSPGEIKKKYSIRDTRTVGKHLALAEREREERESRVHLLKEYLGAHLEEVRQLVQKWQGCFSVRTIQEIVWPGPDPFQEIEQNPLFSVLRAHIPDKELWRGYQAFKEETLAYLKGAADLRAKAKARVPAVSGLPLVDDIKDKGVLKAYGDSAFDLAAKVAQGIEKRDELAALYSEAPIGVPERSPWGLYVAGSFVLSAEGEALRHRDSHLNFVRRLAKSGDMTRLVKSSITLSELAERIRRRIELALLRREYILYCCNLCPGQVKK